MQDRTVTCMNVPLKGRTRPLSRPQASKLGWVHNRSGLPQSRAAEDLGHTRWKHSMAALSRLHACHISLDIPRCFVAFCRLGGRLGAAGQLSRLGALLGRAGHARRLLGRLGQVAGRCVGGGNDLHKEQAVQREQGACRVRVHGTWQLDVVLHRHLHTHACASVMATCTPDFRPQIQMAWS